MNAERSGNSGFCKPYQLPAICIVMKSDSEEMKVQSFYNLRGNSAEKKHVSVTSSINLKTKQPFF